MIPSLWKRFGKKKKEWEDQGEVRVDIDTADPSAAWRRMQAEGRATRMRVPPQPLDKPIDPNSLRFVCISDTHCRVRRMRHAIPDGDVLLHAGDFTNEGSLQEICHFNDFLAKLPHARKVVIAGNHEVTFDDYFWPALPYSTGDGYDMSRHFVELAHELKRRGLSKPSELLTHCTYLQDSAVTICGIVIYGSPWQPLHCGWGFNLRRGADLLDKWNLIPAGVDVLMTHGPPLGYGDNTYSPGEHVGCVELLSTVQQRVRPKYHVFGHIHEGHGTSSDGYTTFINASICTADYSPLNPPIIFDVPIPAGYTKADLLASGVRCEQQSAAPGEGVADCLGKLSVSGVAEKISRRRGQQQYLPAIDE